MRVMMTMHIGRRATVIVADLREASALYQQLRDDSGEGCSTFPDAFVTRGPSVYRISYNGRVWLGSKAYAGQRPILEAA
jgi:hypothetical protein